MAARFPRLIAVVLALAWTASAADAQDRVVTGETLRQAGATSLSEAIALAGAWDVSTVDGFSWDASPLGGSPFRPASWTVLVDGQRMDLSLLGATSLDRLGIPVDQIARIELIEVPRLVAGRITTEGTVAICTRPPGQGASAAAWLATGAEIGDPGPFAFTPKATANVDRIGHEVWGNASYGADTWSASATLGSSLVVPTDPRIVERYIAALGSSPRLGLTAGSARVAATVGGGRHALSLRHSSADDVLDLPPTVGIGARKLFTSIGIAGHMPVVRGRALQYDVSYAANSARSRVGTSEPPFDVDVRTAEGRVELTGGGSRMRTLGLRLSHRGVADATLATVYAEVTPRVRALGELTAGATVTAGEGEAGVAATVARRWRPSRAASIEAVLSFERPAELDDMGLGGERVGADLLWSGFAMRDVAVNGRLLFRRVRQATPGGEQAGGDIEVAYSSPGLPRVRIAYWHRRTVGGGDAFREAWDVVPRHGGHALFEYTPVRGLEMWAAARYRGASRWADSVDVAERVPGAFTLDLAIQKWLWHEQVRVHFGLRNVLGADLRYHPLGATFAPAAVAQIEARLP